MSGPGWPHGHMVPPATRDMAEGWLATLAEHKPAVAGEEPKPEGTGCEVCRAGKRCLTWGTAFGLLVAHPPQPCSPTEDG